MPAATSRRDTLSAQVRHFADIISTLFTRWWWISLAVVALTLWGALNLLLVRSGIVGATVGLGAALSIALAPVTMQQGASMLYPALLLSGFKGLKGIGDSLAPSKVPVLTAVVPLVVTAIVMGSVLQYLSLLHHGADWIATQPMAGSTVATAPSPNASTVTQPSKKASVFRLPTWLVQSPKTPVAPSLSPVKGAVSPLPLVATTIVPPSPVPPTPTTKDTGYIGWLSSNTRQSDALLFHSPSRLHQATQRPVFDLPTAGRPAANIMLMNQAQFLVQDTQQPESSQVVEPLLAEYPNRFRLAYTSDSDHVKIWQIVPKPAVATVLGSPALVAPPTPMLPASSPPVAPQANVVKVLPPVIATAKVSPPPVPAKATPVPPSVKAPIPSRPASGASSTAKKPTPSPKATPLPFTMGEI